MDRRTLHPVERAVGYAFENPEWLAAALRHRSAPRLANDGQVAEWSNARLEFLGDAVLDLTIRALLFVRCPDASEGELTRRRSVLASRATFADIAADIGLEEHLQSNSPLQEGPPSRGQRAMAGCLEALFGAIFMDGGWQAAHEAATPLLAARMAALEREPGWQDHKSALQELVQARTGRAPTYDVIRVDGPDHAPRYEAVAVIAGEPAESGRGPTKRTASQSAARATLARLTGEESARRQRAANGREGASDAGASPEEGVAEGNDPPG
jgi:ribonuclease-3